MLGALANAVAEQKGSQAPGVIVDGVYTAEVLSVASGGLKRGATGRGLGEAAATADLAAVFGAPADTVMRASLLLPHGGDFTADRLGDLQGASNITTYNHPLLYELWLGGKFFDGRVDVRAGRLLADSDFATTESGGVFLNSSFGWPAFISANTRNTGPAFARSALGAYAGVDLGRRVHFHAGIYDGDTYDDPNGDPSRHPNGLYVKLGDGQGTFMIAELALASVAGPTSAPRSGSFKLGAWRHTADFPDQFDSARSHEGNYGFYAAAEQMLWREADSASQEPHGLRGFFRIGFSPGDRSLFAQTADAGVCYTGLFRRREQDTLGLGVACARISSDVRRAERAAGIEIISDYELVIEASYEFAVGERWRVIPDLQWVSHPGGSKRLRDALVVGLRTRVEF